jgi:hypothetical protein
MPADESAGQHVLHHLLVLVAGLVVVAATSDLALNKVGNRLGLGNRSL